MNLKNDSVFAVSDLDLTFGVDGIVALNNPLNPDEVLGIRSIAVDPGADLGQRIYVGGTTSGSQNHAYIVRLLEDGKIDNSFGDEGYVAVPQGNVEDHDAIGIESFVFEESGGITCLGTVYGQPGGEYYGFWVPAAVRMSSPGVIDTSFGDKGLAVYWFPPLEGGELRTDFTPSERDETNPPTVASRSNPSESADPGFAGNARWVEGKILFLARTQELVPFGYDASYLLRINTDGSLDKTFGEEGKVRVTDPSTSPPVDVSCWGYDIDRRGGIVVAGRVGRGPGAVPGIVARYDSQGNLEQEFGQSGVVHFYSGEGGFYEFYPRKVKVLDDGRVIAQAVVNLVPEKVHLIPTIVKLLRNGMRDPDFNKGGDAQVDLASFSYFVDTLALDAGGRMVIASGLGGSPIIASGISRLMPAGIPDDSFSPGGTRIYNELPGEVRQVIIQNRVNILARMSRNIARFIG